MQLGISSYTYSWNIEASDNAGMDEHNLVERAKAFGLHLIQLGDNLPLHTFTEERLMLFEAALHKNDIKLEIGAKGLTLENLRRYILLCKRFDAKILRFIVDDIAFTPSIMEIASLIITAIDSLKQNGIKLVLENHDRLAAKEYAEIIQKVNSDVVGICLDTANSLGRGESIETVVDDLTPHVLNLHIKDFGIERLPHKQGFIIDGRIAGSGMLNIPWLLNKVKRYNKCHTAILEQWVPPESEERRTLAKEILWAEESIKYLKSTAAWD